MNELHGDEEYLLDIQEDLVRGKYKPLPEKESTFQNQMANNEF